MASVVYFGPLRNITNCSSENYDTNSFSDLKAVIAEKYGKEIEELFKFCAFWKNGDEFSDDYLESTDEIEILPPVSGG